MNTATTATVRSANFNEGVSGWELTPAGTVRLYGSPSQHRSVSASPSPALDR